MPAKENIYKGADDTRKLINDAHRRERPFFFALDYELERGIFLEGEELESGGVLFKVGSRTNAPADARKLPHAACAEITPHPVPYREYLEKFETVMRAIRRGDSFLANLTIRTPVSCPLSLREIFGASESPYALCVPGDFVCFSPETFVKIEGGEIRSNPMKGTAECSGPGSLARLMGDEKELREHRTIVDLIRNDLSRVARRVRVARFRYAEIVERAGRPPIIQTSSEIRGTMRPAPLGDALFEMLPAGSVSGAPKLRTVAALREAEGGPRGFYSGVFGFFDGENLDSAVAIRFIEKSGGGLFFRSGGGITGLSSPEGEYREAVDKIYLNIANP